MRREDGRLFGERLDREASRRALRPILAALAVLILAISYALSTIATASLCPKYYYLFRPPLFHPRTDIPSMN